MDVPFTTIGTVVGTNIVRAIAASGAESAATSGGAPTRRANTISAFVGAASAAACLGAGYYMGGMRKPNTFARGLVWAGGLGLVFGLPSFMGAAVAEGSAPEAQPAKIGGPLDIDLVNDTMTAMRRQIGI